MFILNIDPSKENKKFQKKNIIIIFKIKKKPPVKGTFDV